MYPLYFPAVLLSADGKFLTEGEACLSEASGAVDFNGEFVPLLRLGAEVQVVRVLGETPLERFPGQVYRCTKKSLRVTGIPETALAGARALFEVNAHFPASIFLSPDNSFRFAPEKARRLDGNIRFVSSVQLKITAMEPIADGQKALVTAGALSLDRLLIRVAKRTPLGQNAAVLLCDVFEPTLENARALARYAASREPPIRLL